MELYTIGQASAMLGIPIRTIRYYESIGLCVPTRTDEGSGYRYYSMDDMFRLDLIRCLGCQLGMPLKTIRRYLKEAASTETLKTYLLQQAEDIDGQMEELRRRKDFLTQKLAAIERLERTPQLQVYEETLPARELSARRESVETLDDAVLITRKLAAQSGAEGGQLFLIFDSLGESYTQRGRREIVIGISGRVRSQGLDFLELKAGRYLSVDYPFRTKERATAISLLRSYMKERGLRRAGPMVNIGSLIDATAASSIDYCVKTQLRVEPE